MSDIKPPQTAVVASNDPDTRAALAAYLTSNDIADAGQYPPRDLDDVERLVLAAR